MDKIKKVEVQIVNAFVDNNKGGNPAGVVLDAEDYTNEQKLKIAAKVGLSETAFVSKSGIADFKLEFFSPNRQIAHCGHATIATFSYLSQLGKIKNPNSSKETIDGKRDIKIIGEMAFMEQQAPTYRDVSARKQLVLKSLNLKEDDIPSKTPITLVNTGNSFLIIPVSDINILSNIKPDFDLINQLSEEFDLVGYYVFAFNGINSERDVTTRMFAPRYGIEEEAGTGMAAGTLACYLYDKLSSNKSHFLIEQGHFMKVPSPSLIIVDLVLEESKIKKLMAGGKGISTSKMIIEI
ncbi:PhzF family phenazine biosynthesis protein [Flavobacterium sp.]|uniref:PhzF family phenazine biosynthesis protein n=1 Tax=Flavobacterium sp. TaxID=239 RepID=UPI00374D2C6A